MTEEAPNETPRTTPARLPRPMHDILGPVIETVQFGVRSLVLTAEPDVHTHRRGIGIYLEQRTVDGVELVMRRAVTHLHAPTARRLAAALNRAADIVEPDEQLRQRRDGEAPRRPGEAPRSFVASNAATGIAKEAP